MLELVDPITLRSLWSLGPVKQKLIMCF